MPVGQLADMEIRIIGRILTVDPTQRLVEVALKGDTVPRRVQITTTPVAFRWPVVDESWMVYQKNNIWYLGEPLPAEPISAQGDAVSPTTIESISAGDAIINSPTGVVHVQGSSTGNSDFTFSGPAVIPATGTMYPQASGTLPIGWLWCDGSAVSRTTYATLFAAIGTTYGAGNGTTTFNVPDVQGPVATGHTILWTIFTGIVAGGFTPPATMGAVGGDLAGTLPSPTFSPQGLSKMLQPTNNLSDVTTVATARANLGLGPPVWTALAYNATNWTDYGSGEQAGQWCLDGMGFVHIRGLAKSVAGYSFGTFSTTVIAVLPPAARPLKSVEGICIQIDSGGNHLWIRTVVDAATGNLEVVDGPTGTGIANNGVVVLFTLNSFPSYSVN